MSTGTIHIGDLAREQEAIVRTLHAGFQLVEGGIKKAFGNTYDEYDEAVDLENEQPPEEPDPSWPNDRLQ